jgi:hypothetical protein
MYKHILGLTTSALILAHGTLGAIAEDRTTPQPDQQQMQSHPMGQEGEFTMGHPGMMGGAMMEHMMEARHDGWRRNGATNHVSHDVCSD